MQNKTNKSTNPNMEYKESITIKGKVIKKSRIAFIGKDKIPRLDIVIRSTLNDEPHIYKSVVWGRKAFNIKKNIKRHDDVIAEGRPTKNNCLNKPFYYFTIDTCITVEEHNALKEFEKLFIINDTLETE